MSYCGQCGHRLGAGRFCPNCGFEVRTEPEGDQETTKPAAAVETTMVRPVDAVEATAPRRPRATTPPPTAPTMPPPTAPTVPPPTASSARYPLFAEPPAEAAAEAPPEEPAEEPASDALATTEMTAVRPLRTADDTAPRPHLPSLSETAVRPAVSVEAAVLSEPGPEPEPGPELESSSEVATDQPSAWIVSLWVLILFLIVILVGGLWLLGH